MRDWKAYVHGELSGLDLSGPREAEIVEELAQHLESSYEDSVARGASEDEVIAHVATLFPEWDALRRELRQVEASRHSSRDISYTADGGWFAGLRQDVRVGVRGLAKTPGFTAIAILILALGIGANAVIFTIVDGVLLRPLPYEAPERLALIRGDVEGESAIASISAVELLDFRERTQLFEGFAGVWASSAALTGLDTPEQIRYALATRNLFSLLGTEPLLGRTFTEEEEAENGPLVVVLSSELWQRRFGADPGIVGQSIELDDAMRVVVGVLPPGFRLLMGADTDVSSEIEAWVPQNYWINRDLRWLRVIGRVREGVSFEQAQQEMDVVSQNLENEFTEYADSELGFYVEPLHGDLVRDVKPAIVALFGAVGFVLLVVCANVANLLLVRTQARSKEIAVRAALGATRGRIVRQLLTESALLALTGGALGVAVAYGAVSVLPWLAPPSLPRLDELTLDARVLTFAAVAALVTSVVFGLLPAVHATRLRLHDTLKAGGRSGSGIGASLRDGLVVAEVALSFVLLIGAGLMARTLVNLGSEPLGFESESVLTMEVPLSLDDYETPESQWQFHRALKERIEALPGVRSSGAVSLLPFSGGLFTSPYAVHEDDVLSFGEASADYRSVVPGYFESIGAQIVEGRALNDTDSVSGRRVVIVDETLASSAWPGESAVGKRINVDLQAGVVETRQEWMDVIGVVRHVRQERIEADGRPQIYFPLWIRRTTRMSLVVETRGDPDLLVASVQGAVAELGNNRPVHTVSTMQHYVDVALSRHRFTVTVMLVFAGLALLLAAIGVYGVISFAVGQRMHELGIRVALGATVKDLLEMVLRHGAGLALGGCAAGVIGAMALGRYLESLVFGVSTTDPVTFIVVAIMLVGVTLLACARPAWRSANVDPTISLRHE